MSDINKYITDNNEERENLKMGFEQIKSMYALQLERLKSASHKRTKKKLKSRDFARKLSR